MSIRLFSGLPGAGKTAAMVAELVRLRDKEPNRPIFQWGINGLKDGLAIPLTEDMLHKWSELPPGSIILIDECQEDGSAPGTISLFPKDRGNPPAWVQYLSKHRHHGMDFLLTTQSPNNMSAYVRRLVDEHTHIVRKFRSQVVQRYTWGRCIDDPYARKDQKEANVTVGTLPKEVFDLYKSSQLHTMKRRIPWKVMMIPVLVVVLVVCVLLVPKLMHQSASKVTPPVVGGSGGFSGQVVQDESLRRSDMAKWMRPRVSGVPWSAPMFDKLEVQAHPRLFCVAVDDGRCTCNTEQGTHYDVPLKQCRLIVENGLYNPFLAPSTPDDQSVSGGQAADQRGRREAASPPAVHAESAPVDSTASVSGVWKSSPLSSSYVPPQLMTRPAYTPTQLH